MGCGMEKIISWNVASIRARMPALTRLLQEEKPDIVLLQEIKSTEETFPFMELARAGYHAFISGQKGYNGVAILSREQLSLQHTDLPDFTGEKQARFVECGTGNRHYISVYVPNGNPTDKDPTDARLQYKLKWMDCLTRYIDALLKEGQSVILGGDFNVILRDTDVYNPEPYRTNALMVEPVRKALFRLIQTGLTDSIRLHDPSEHLYSFWDFQMGAWRRNWGMLLDNIFISTDIICSQSGILKTVRGWEKTSDHAPVWGLFE